jgi:hypothetical protein
MGLNDDQNDDQNGEVHGILSKKHGDLMGFE